MKKLLSFLLAVCLVCVVFVGFEVSAFADDEIRVSLHDCDTLENVYTNKEYNALNDEFVKQGDFSIRATTFWIGTVIYNLDFAVQSDEKFDLSGIKYDEAYLEFWIYTQDSDTFNHSVDSYVRLASDNDMWSANRFEYRMENYKFQKGWNYVSLPLKDFSGYGSADYNNIVSMSIHVQLEYMCFGYIDDISITNRQYVPDSSELGFKGAASPIVYDENASGELLSDYSGKALLIVLVSVLSVTAVALATVIVVIYLKKARKRK